MKYIEKLNEAKEIIGEVGKDLIANELKFEKWDGDKACCHWHEEDTASLIWHKKNNYFKCFGCGKVYSVIDHYIEFHRKSFKQATEILFQMAKQIDENFDVEIKDFKNEDYFQNYNYPTVETDHSLDKILPYMNKRGFTEQTLRFGGVKQDEKGNIVYEHRDEDSILVASKYRSANKNKDMWWQKGADTCPILWGIDKIDITKPLVVVEGHNDRLACLEAGYMNTVSIPHGAENTKWIEFNWDWLENFDKIILWFDNDRAGIKGRNESITRLGEHRCFIVDKFDLEIVTKVEEIFKVGKCDANNVLYACGKQDVLNLINNARDIPVTDMIDLMECEDFDIDEAEHVPTSFRALDSHIYSHVMGSFNIWTGYTGHGKSTVLNQSCIAEPLEQGYSIFLFSGELGKGQLKNWVLTPLAGGQHIFEQDNGKYRPKSYKITKEAKEKMEDYYKGKIHFYDNFLDCTPESILSKMKHTYMRHGTKIFIIDNLMCVDCGEGDNKYDNQKKFVMALIDFCNKYGTTIHLVAHPKKPNGFAKLTEYDIFGSSNIPNLTHRIFSVRRVSQSEKEGVMNKGGDYIEPPNEYDTMLEVLKDRITGVKGVEFGLFFDFKTKRFFGKSDNKNRRYSWDDKSIEYKNNIASRLVCNQLEYNEKDYEELIGKNN